jgi:UPF0755 protein
LLTIFTLALIAGCWLAYTFSRPAVKLADPDKPFLYVHSGETFEELKSDLEQHYLKGKGFGIASKILRFKNPRPGRYKLKNRMNFFSLVRMLRNGQQSESKIVIIKERTRQAFAGKFGKGRRYDTEFDSTAMIDFLSNKDTLDNYGLDTNTVMSVVMPYTYDTKWNTTPTRVFRQFYLAYQKFWNEERKTKAGSLNLTPTEVITLASIVEEETNNKEDKYKIASTYINRLKIGMRLQADPTIKYAWKNFALKRITGSYLAINSPYNTYSNAGLPPGPICTPSVETIDAVLDAPNSDYLYFVASDKFDGSSIFTSNLADHQKYAKLYQKELTRRMDSVKKARAIQQ